MNCEHPATLLLLFNHRLTVNQEVDARTTLGVEQIISPPPEISRLWAEIPPEQEDISTWLAPVVEWLASHAQPGNYVLVQGEFVATFRLVNEALRLALIPISSTTRREAMEEHLPDGSVRIRHIFSHVRYRRYMP